MTNSLIAVFDDPTVDWIVAMTPGGQVAIVRDSTMRLPPELNGTKRITLADLRSSAAAIQRPGAR